MGVLLNAGSVRPVLGIWAVTRQAKGVALLAHNSRIVGAVRIVTTEAGDAARIHQALDEIIPLHSVLVCCPVRKMREGRFSKLVFLQSPKVRQMQADVKTDRPIVVFAFDRIAGRAPL